MTVGENKIMKHWKTDKILSGKGLISIVSLFYSLEH